MPPGVMSGRFEPETRPSLTDVPAMHEPGVDRKRLVAGIRNEQARIGGATLGRVMEWPGVDGRPVTGMLGVGLNRRRMFRF
jgi:hypothetical protein